MIIDHVITFNLIIYLLTNLFIYYISYIAYHNNSFIWTITLSDDLISNINNI